VAATWACALRHSFTAYDSSYAIDSALSTSYAYAVVEASSDFEAFAAESFIDA
jgi:hypothetical protein